MLSDEDFEQNILPRIKAFYILTSCYITIGCETRKMPTKMTKVHHLTIVWNNISDKNVHQKSCSCIKQFNSFKLFVSLHKNMFVYLQ